jgi:Flp pilus assembly protein TadG
MILAISNRIERLRLKVRSYMVDPSGVAAVEFGLIVPFLMIMFLGSVEYSRATMYARRFNLATAMASDLIAREYLLDDADLAGVARAVDTVWGSYDNLASLKLQVLHVRQAGNLATKKPPGTTYSEWSYSIRGAPSIPACQNYTLPVANMLQNGNSVLVVNGTYTYRTLFGLSAPGITSANMNWTATSSHAPRDLCVAYNKANCVTNCE